VDLLIASWPAGDGLVVVCAADDSAAAANTIQENAIVKSRFELIANSVRIAQNLR
jgi:hypothetical protein